MSVSSLLQAFASSSRGDLSDNFCKDFIFRGNILNSVVKCMKAWVKKLNQVDEKVTCGSRDENEE